MIIRREELRIDPHLTLEIVHIVLLVLVRHQVGLAVLPILRSKELLTIDSLRYVSAVIRYKADRALRSSIRGDAFRFFLLFLYQEVGGGDYVLLIVPIIVLVTIDAGGVGVCAQRWRMLVPFRVGIGCLNFILIRDTVI